MHKRVLCRHAVFVRLSVTFVDSVETNKYIFKIFCRVAISGSHSILVFRYQTSWQYSDGTPLTEASNAGGVGKNRDSGRIAGYRSMTGGVRTTNATATMQFTAQTATHQ